MTAKLLNTVQAAALSGMSINTIYSAAKSGALPARKVKPAGTCQGGGWKFKPNDVRRWMQTAAPKPQNYESWTEADVAALVELHASDECTREQIAAYLGRSFMAVKLKLRELRKKGVISHTSIRHKTAFRMSPGSMLIAKTCLSCGQLRDAAQFDRPTGRSYKSRCVHCVRTAARGQSSSSAKVRKQLQDVTRSKAFNEGARYTPDEIEQLKDFSRNDLSLALDMGRSLYAVWNKRLKLGLKPESTKWRDVDDSHWLINFPNAMAVLREHFRALGEPVPESLWEWDDDDREVA